MAPRHRPRTVAALERGRAWAAALASSAEEAAETRAAARAAAAEAGHKTKSFRDSQQVQSPGAAPPRAAPFLEAPVQVCVLPSSLLVRPSTLALSLSPSHPLPSLCGRAPLSRPRQLEKAQGRDRVLAAAAYYAWLAVLVLLLVWMIHGLGPAAGGFPDDASEARQFNAEHQERRRALRGAAWG